MPQITWKRAIIGSCLMIMFVGCLAVIGGSLVIYDFLNMCSNGKCNSRATPTVVVQVIRTNTPIGENINPTQPAIITPTANWTLAPTPLPGVVVTSAPSSNFVTSSNLDCNNANSFSGQRFTWGQHGSVALDEVFLQTLPTGGIAFLRYYQANPPRIAEFKRATHTGVNQCTWTDQTSGLYVSMTDSEVVTLKGNITLITGQ